MNSKNSNEKIQSIQALRGVAFLLIFISHCSFLTNRTSYLGAFGVQIFIMLSGFLVMLAEEKCQKQSSIIAVKKKIRKLFPLHFATFLMSIPISGIYDIFCGESNILVFGIKAIINLSMMQSFVPMKFVYYSFNSVSWYLTLTLFFTVCSKLFLYAMNKIKDYYWCIFYALWGVQLIWTLAAKDCINAHWFIYINPFFRLTDYIIGMCVAVGYKKKIDKDKCSLTSVVGLCSKLIRGIVFCYLLSILSYSFLSDENNPWLWCFVWTPGAVLTLQFFVSHQTYIFGGGTLTFIGNISMELFLLHQLIIKYCEKTFAPQVLFLKLILVLICCVTAIICSLVWKKFREELLY